MRKIVVANDIMAAETRRLIDEGNEVLLRVKGSSMLPFIHGDIDEAVLRKAPDDLKRWDIILAYDVEGRLLLHRIIKIDDEVITMMGDGNVHGVEKCFRGDVIAQLVEVQRGNRRWACNSPRARRKAILWYHLRPIRRYLLAINRRLPQPQLQKL